jgi:hypothetical protein
MVSLEPVVIFLDVEFWFGECLRPHSAGLGNHRVIAVRQIGNVDQVSRAYIRPVRAHRGHVIVRKEEKPWLARLHG